MTKHDKSEDYLSSCPTYLELYGGLTLAGDISLYVMAQICEPLFTDLIINIYTAAGKIQAHCYRLPAEFKGNRNSFRGGNFVETIFATLLKRGYSKRKDFAPLGSKFFPFRVDPFSEES